MEEQDRLSKQNSIFSKVEKHEKVLKNILLLIIILIIMTSSVLSLAFSYKSYREVKNIMIEDKKNEEETFSYETLLVSYSNGSLLSCSSNGCNSTVVNLTNNGDDTIFCNISFTDINGDDSNYIYGISSMNVNKRDRVPNKNLKVLKNIEIKPKESMEYNISLNTNDGIIYGNYQLRIQVDLNSDKNIFLN